MQKMNAAITAVGGYVPETKLTNFDLEKMVDKGSSDMAVPAIEEILRKKGMAATDIDCIICATVTPDMVFPATANIIADKIGATNAWGYDMSAACSGFLYALTTGAMYIESGRFKKVIVVGVDKMSAIIDYTDRATCIIFGDGAGAVLLEPTTEDIGIKDSILRSDGSGRQYLHMKAGGSVKPASVETVLAKEHFAYQEGQAVFKFAVKGMADVSAELLERNNLTGDDIAWLVPHQANLRIIDATANRMGLPKEKVMINIHRYGNTTAATIPLCLWEWQSQLKKGDNIVLAAFGGGFTWGATWVKWGY
ncbi:MAG: beta-ketoacyl-ACP synthase [Bacteroidota bacterium]